MGMKKIPKRFCFLFEGPVKNEKRMLVAEDE